MSLIFEWDEEKAANNLEKHAISFEEASTVFRDSVDRRFDIWRAHTGDHTIDGFDGPAEEARHAL